MRSHLLKFPAKAIKLHAVEIFTLSLYDAGCIYPQVLSFILTSRTLNAPSLVCFANTSYKTRRIGGHIKYVITKYIIDCSAMPLTLSCGVNQFT